ncbi:hypothetical protein ACFE04_011273 [Oxalis oulophora]
MASSSSSNLHNKLYLHLQTSNSSPSNFPLTNHSLPFPKHHRTAALSISASSSSSSSSSSSPPPTSKQDAILQATSCLSSTLEKPLNNPKLPISKLKKLKQPRYRVEIPLPDDHHSTHSLTQLALDVFANLRVKKRISDVRILIIWPNITFSENAAEAFEASAASYKIQNVDISSVDSRRLNLSDVAVFVAPDRNKLWLVKTVTDSLYPKPVVMFNPKWGYEEEQGFGDLKSFVASFEVIYSFMGLEVKGILSKRKGMIFKCVRNGVLSGEKWNVLVEEEGKSEMKLVSSFKVRPSIEEVEMVLYNLMAMNSPITKSAKFFKNLVSSVTGKK